MIPNDLEPEAVDIIDRLLQLDYRERLGAGPFGSANDFEALKNHPYFKGINFKVLDQTAPPVPMERFAKLFYETRYTALTKDDLEELHTDLDSAAIAKI